MKKEITEMDYDRPRCVVLLELPFGFFIAKYVKIKVEAGAKGSSEKDSSPPHEG